MEIKLGFACMTTSDIQLRNLNRSHKKIPTVIPSSKIPVVQITLVQSVRKFLDQGSFVCKASQDRKFFFLKVHSHYTYAFASACAFASNCNIVSMMMLH